MGVDVRAETRIARPRDDVWRFATNPENDPRWIGGITQARVVDGPAEGKGSRVERIAKFLGRRIEYVNEVVAYEPPARLEMRSIKSPFPMRVTYEFDDGGGDTVARIRVEGDAGGFYRIAAPLLAGAVKRNITKDLGRLKSILESPGSG